MGGGRPWPAKSARTRPAQKAHEQETGLGGGADLVEGVAELLVGFGLELGLGRQCLPKNSQVSSLVIYSH